MAERTQDEETLLLNEMEQNKMQIAIGSVTFYEGSAPVKFLRNRISKILEKNPWLTGRVVKRGSGKYPLQLTYSKHIDVESIVDQYFESIDPGTCALNVGMSYQEIATSLNSLAPVPTSKAIDKDESLFKVLIVPFEELKVQERMEKLPLETELNLPAFALVFFMSHTIADGHTFYKVYNMLSIEAKVEIMDPIRVTGFDEAVRNLSEISSVRKGCGSMCGFMCKLFGLVCLPCCCKPRRQSNFCVHEVNPAWVEREKAKAKDEGQVPFVSTNDAVTSWFFRYACKNPSIFMMAANCRDRQPDICGVTDLHAGNYETLVVYYGGGDCEKPSLIRQSIRNPDGTFRTKRLSDSSPPLGCWGQFRSNTSIITNWSSFPRDVNLNVPGESECTEKLHLPLYEPSGFVALYNLGIIFRARANKLGFWCMSDYVNSDVIARNLESDNPNAALGERII